MEGTKRWSINVTPIIKEEKLNHSGIKYRTGKKSCTNGNHYILKAIIL